MPVLKCDGWNGSNTKMTSAETASMLRISATMRASTDSAPRNCSGKRPPSAPMAGHLTPSFDGCESPAGRGICAEGREALSLQPIKPIRVMLVDDHRSVLWGLEKLIDGDRPRMEVVGKATSCAAAMELAERISPDVVVLDLDLGGENACEIIPVLVNGGGTRVLVWTGMRDS